MLATPGRPEIDTAEAKEVQRLITMRRLPPGRNNPPRGLDAPARDCAANRDRRGGPAVKRQKGRADTAVPGPTPAPAASLARVSRSRRPVQADRASARGGSA